MACCRASEVETAQTAYDTAVAQYNAAQADVESAETKLRAARAQLVAAEAQVEKANAQVHQAQAALEQARVDLERTIIRSPVTGTVISRSVDVGQTVAASLSSPTLFTIAQDLTKCRWTRMSAKPTLALWPLARWRPLRWTPTRARSCAVRCARFARRLSWCKMSVNYNAVIAVDNPEQKLKPGMTATVSILVAQRQNVLKIPKAALRFQPQLTPRSASSSSRPSRSNRWRVRRMVSGAAPRKVLANHPQSLDADSRKVRPVAYCGGSRD